MQARHCVQIVYIAPIAIFIEYIYEICSRITTICNTNQIGFVCQERERGERMDEGSDISTNDENDESRR